MGLMKLCNFASVILIDSYRTDEGLSKLSERRIGVMLSSKIYVTPTPMLKANPSGGDGRDFPDDSLPCLVLQLHSRVIAGKCGLADPTGGDVPL